MGSLIPILSLLIASAAAGSPFISKKYRSDYEYYKETDAFYKLHTETASLIRARQVCQAEGADLMTPESAEDLRQLHAMFKQYPDIGSLMMVFGDGADHDEATEDEIPMIQLEEASDEHDHRLFTCEAVNRQGEIESYPCYLELPFICKIKAKDAPYNDECSVYSKDYVSKISLTGSCYRIATKKADWNEAYANCQAEGAHLLILNNEGEFEVVKDLIDHTSRHVEYWQFFVGIRAEKKEPLVYMTIFNQTLDQVGYQPWAAGEPNNEFGVEFCVSILKSNGKYNDTVCRNRYSYICEKERRS